MILELDCGNTRVKWRVRDHHKTLMRGMFLTGEGFHPSTTAELADANIEQVLVGSVLSDDYARKLAAWSISHLGVNPQFAVSEPHCNGVVNGYQQPEKLGVDRWLAILAAKAKDPSACVIVDCGSAITVDLVTSQGEHLGGYIAPGLRLMREALATKTSAIKLGQIGYPENDFPGRNTVLAIKSAELAMIAGLVEHAKSILRNYDSHGAHLLVTGGDGEWLVSMLKEGAYHEDLVMDGLDIALAEVKT
ncbi:type III pantothenate kinase [Cellvibrio zantedeschiae]|uniref:Type III pantothenate kinase n=1 Tax=Cellvibrio zantedeschiae TaxID=1237077 RepID=A0ABQ3APK5_9GAMM|nr:type III pantothenate kinase [Cellvibrio zantedeschiae]GGY60753.1 type III pantothenate kinase [Cellvibrio zantedeschiae]